jgi:hypothetical protein
MCCVLRKYCYDFAVIVDSKANLSAFWRGSHCPASLSPAHASSFAAKALILNGFNLRTASNCASSGDGQESDEPLEAHHADNRDILPALLDLPANFQGSEQNKGAFLPVI